MKVIVALILVFICGAAKAGEISRTEDINDLLTLDSYDYHNAPSDIWTPIVGAALEKYLSHRWFAGRYIEKRTINNQTTGASLQGRVGDIYSTNKLGSGRTFKGDLRIEADRYCVYWHRYGELCYRVLAGVVNGKPVHLLTRDDGKIYMGIELLFDE